MKKYNLDEKQEEYLKQLEQENKELKEKIKLMKFENETLKKKNKKEKEIIFENEIFE
jgi:cell division protein FtsB